MAFDADGADEKGGEEAVGGGEVGEEEPLMDGMVRRGLLSVVCGYAQTVEVKVKGSTVDLTLVSRRSRFRSGV